jgi:hypothetical protein
VWSDILQSQAHEIAAPQLTVDCQIEESQASRSLRELQSRSDGSNPIPATNSIFLQIHPASACWPAERRGRILAA